MTCYHEQQKNKSAARVSNATPQAYNKTPPILQLCKPKTRGQSCAGYVQSHGGTPNRVAAWALGGEVRAASVPFARRTPKHGYFERSDALRNVMWCVHVWSLPLAYECGPSVEGLARKCWRNDIYVKRDRKKKKEKSTTHGMRACSSGHAYSAKYIHTKSVCVRVPMSKGVLAS